MPDRLQTAIERMDARIRERFGRSITYRRGLQTVAVTSAVIAQPRQRLEAEEQLRTETRYRDWLIAAAALVIGGSVVRPNAGDQVVDAGTVWQVFSDQDGTCVDADDDGVTLRIHTQQVCG